MRGVRGERSLLRSWMRMFDKVQGMHDTHQAAYLLLGTCPHLKPSESLRWPRAERTIE